MTPARTLLFAALLAPAYGQSAYRASQVVFVGSQVADLASNWSGPEQNRLLANTDGRMGAQGRMLKAGFTVGVLALQKWTPKRWRRGWTVFNLIVGGSHTAVAVYNWRGN